MGVCCYGRRNNYYRYVLEQLHGLHEPPTRRSLSQPLILDIRNERNVFLDIVGSLVMRRMCDAPGVKGNQQKRVQHQPQSVVDPFLGAQSLVAGLMGDLPYPSEDKTLQQRVGGPSQQAHIVVLEFGYLRYGHRGQAKDVKKIP